jgi:hypothetical protein
MVFRTAGFQPAHDHEPGWKPAVRKSVSYLRSTLAGEVVWLAMLIRPFDT